MGGGGTFAYHNHTFFTTGSKQDKIVVEKSDKPL